MLKNEKRKVALFTQMITLFVFCCTFFLNTQDVSAASPYFVDYAEPTYGDNSGYLILEYASGKVGVFAWSAFTQSEYINEFGTFNTGCSLVIDENKVIFTILTDNNIDTEITNVSTQYFFCNYNSSGQFGIMKSGSVVDSNPTHTYTTSGTIVGFTYRGNVSIVTNQLDGGNSNPIVSFGDDLTARYVQELYTLTGQMNNAFTVYLPKLNKIEAWESRNNEQLELLVEVTNDILEALSKDDTATEISGLQSTLETFSDLMLDSMTDILADTEHIDSILTQFLPYLVNINEHICNIEFDVDQINNILEDFTEIMVEVTNAILSDTDHIDSLLTKFLPYIVDMNTHICNIEFDVDEMKPILSNLLTVCENLYDSTAHIESLCLQFLPYIVDMNTHICNIEYDVNTIDNNVASIDARIKALSEALLKSTLTEKENMDNFMEDSVGQSNALNHLNGEATLNKPDVDDMNAQVDANLNMNVDANYGLLLSTFTSNNRIVTMLLMVAATSLVSYVFFGKR